jgi:hypothetical protein
MAKYLRSKTGKKERKRRKAFSIRLYGGIFLLLLLIAGFFWLMQKPFMRISDFGVRGLDTLEAAEIISVSKENLLDKHLLFIPRDNFIFYSKRKIKDALFEYDARIKEIDIDASRHGDLTITIEEYKPEYLYCKETCFYTDSNGYVYRSAEGVPRELYIVFEDEVDTEPLRANFVPEFWLEVESLLNFFNEEGVGIRTVVYEGGVDFVFYTYDDAAIKVDFDESLRTLHKYLGIFIDSNRDLVLSGSLEYIDARFGKKIFYKRNIEEEEVSEELEI